MALPTAIPRHIDLQACRTDPLLFLRAAQSTSGNLVAISEGPIFSRAADCCEAVAVFGPDAVREVLSDIDLFGMPVSVAEKFSLPERLVALNKGLFSMHGEEHRRHQQLLSPLLGANSVQRHSAAIAQGWAAFADELRAGEDLPLLEEMRRLVLHVTSRVLFGDGLEAGRLIQSYFDQRRSLSGGSKPQTLEDRRKLVRTGVAIERSLRTRLSRLREEYGRDPGRPLSVLAELANSGERISWQPDDSELVAHGNVLFMSGSEPIAVSLAWILLLLSQRPDLCLAARQEISAAFGGCEIPDAVSETELPLLHRIILETHRLLPPNAIMVRLTRRPGKLLGYDLPEQCEVVLSPFVAHRDPRQYADPDRFDAARWIDLQPRPFCYFPFGMGGRYCLGKSLATAVLLSILTRLLNKYEVVLAGDVELDWKMDITLMPKNDAMVRFQPLTANNESFARGRLGGPVSRLLQFDCNPLKAAR
jgi:cytochrome P450